MNSAKSAFGNIARATTENRRIAQDARSTGHRSTVGTGIEHTGRAGCRGTGDHTIHNAGGDGTGEVIHTTRGKLAPPGQVRRERGRTRSPRQPRKELREETGRRLRGGRRWLQRTEDRIEQTVQPTLPLSRSTGGKAGGGVTLKLRDEGVSGNLRDAVAGGG